MTSKPFVYLAAAAVFGICTYLFIKGNKIYAGQFENEPLSWYFFAKGIFCAVSLILTREVIVAIRSRGV